MRRFQPAAEQAAHPKSGPRRRPDELLGSFVTHGDFRRTTHTNCSPRFPARFSSSGGTLVLCGVRQRIVQRLFSPRCDSRLATNDTHLWPRAQRTESTVVRMAYMPRLAGGTIPFRRRYTVITPYSSHACPIADQTSRARVPMKFGTCTVSAIDRSVCSRMTALP
jgi:hypothetical protein